MIHDNEPRFLTREILDDIHEEQIDAHGGLHGVRDENALESAIAAAENVHHYGGGDVYDVAAAYVYHVAESQAYLDGNKRTGLEAGLVFLEGHGIDTSCLPDDQTYNVMMSIAAHDMDRTDLAEHFRSTLTQEYTSEHEQREGDKPMLSDMLFVVDETAKAAGEVVSGVTQEVAGVVNDYTAANPNSTAPPAQQQEAAYAALSVDDPVKYPPANDEMKAFVEERRASEAIDLQLREASGASLELSPDEQQAQIQDRMQSYIDQQKQFSMSM